jgi:hypothetical protein
MKTQRQLRNEACKTFEDIFNQLLDEAEKEAERQANKVIRILDIIAEMREKANDKGDDVQSYIKVEECPCSNQCGSFKITLKYEAISHNDGVIKIREGELIRIIMQE